MKINGKKLSGPRIEVVVIPRPDGDLVFRAQAVLDYEDFDRLHPMPNPPQVMRPGGLVNHNVESPKYQKALTEWSESKTHYMVLKSLEATENLEWETVDMSDPSTWENYQAEMQEAGLSPLEIGRIVMCVTDACGLNQQKIDEATKRFLAGQVEAHGNGSSQSIEPKSTPSGEPVSVST